MSPRLQIRENVQEATKQNEKYKHMDNIRHLISKHQNLDPRAPKLHSQAAEKQGHIRGEDKAGQYTGTRTTDTSRTRQSDEKGR